MIPVLSDSERWMFEQCQCVQVLNHLTIQALYNHAVQVCFALDLRGPGPDALRAVYPVMAWGVGPQKRLTPEFDALIDKYRHAQREVAKPESNVVR